MLWFQNNISKLVGVLTLILLFALSSNAQTTVTVQDPAFNSALCNFTPTSMTAGCLQLDTVLSLSANGNIVLQNKNITNADEIVFFKNADTIRLSFNNLTSLPVDISRFRHLNRLSVTNNQLTVAPTIHYTNPVTGDTAIKFVYLLNNKITSLPASWDSYNYMTQVIDLRNNELQQIPTFANYPEMRRLDLRDNRLGFEYLIPIKQNPRWTSSIFSLFPQKQFPVTMDTLVKIGQVLHVNISSGLPSNEYTLLIDNRNIEVNRTGDFYIAINSIADTGQYWFKIRNDSFPSTSDFLKSEFKNVKIDPENDKYKDVVVFSPNGDGNADVVYIEGTGTASIINKNGVTVLSNINLPYIWNGTDKNGKLLNPSLYYIQKSDGTILKALLIN
jgi:hypothetical protein